MMRAISLTQPWCGLMAAGIKLIENRSQPIIAERDFGEPFGLHATRAIDNRVYQRIYEIAPETWPPAPAILSEQRWHQLSQITSAILATAVIDRVVKAVDYDDISDRYIYDVRDLEGIGPEQRRFMFGRFCYVFRPSPVVLPAPVHCRGFQSFWKMDGETERAVRSQLAEMAA